MNDLIIKKDFKIKSERDLGQSVVLLTRANNKLAEMEAERKKITAPMREALAEVMSRYKPMTDELNLAVEIIRKEQSRYQTALIQQRLKEEEKITKKIGKSLTLETAVAKMEQLEEVKNKVTTDIGSLSFSSKETYEVMDIVMLMEKTGPEFVMPNDEKIKLAMKEGIKLPGVEYKIIQIPVNFRNK